ncbi:hypothetical protein CYLTODRAFT_416772 [Cylindrobasidium torrendii FP15055 ss-10]|uniref:Zn(2)-C6 fungal-type domain-containing protein n=1 Tax=Cylindrobasidium torrendii FP15055 ss-10 TaxID=1314674 RepID=A0A0D7BTM6_9AGAR|nr:hypothetical protein CYLTODRAFT_416772 [Cylindrobasidium torrendii FP15055 ss-10]
MSTKPCGPCRTRKLRCDGLQPTCTSCARSRKSMQCVYDSEVAARSRSDQISKGAACMACRRKKKKCDGKRPFCTTCVTAGKEDDCQYEDGMHMSVRAQLQERIKELEAKLAAYDPGDGDDHGLGSEIDSALADGLDALGSIQDDAAFGLGDILSLGPTASGSGSGITTMMTNSLDLDPIREVFFTHRAQCGLCLTEQRILALRSGDITVVHPVLLYTAQLWGCLVNENDKSCFRQLTESVQLQSALDCLNDARNIIDPTTAMEAHTLLCMFFFAKGDIFRGREHILKASHVLIEHERHLLSLAQSIRQLATYRSVTLGADEDVASICQALYMDQSQHIQFKTPLLFPESLYTELRGLPELYSVLALDSFCVTARSISLAYYRESHKIISAFVEEGCCATRSEMWYTKYMDMLHQTNAHLAHVQTRLVNTMLVSDDMHTRTLKVAELILLGVLIDLHSVLAPTVLESRQAAVEAVSQILVITESFKDDDYARLCPMITYAWNSCISTIHAEINQLYPLFTADETTHALNVIKRNADMLGKKMLYINVSVDAIPQPFNAIENGFSHLL